MQVWNLLHTARWKHKTQKSSQKSLSGHHPTILSGYIFATKAHIDNWKKNLLSSNMSSRCPHNMVNFGPLAAEIDPVVWGTPANFNRFRILGVLLHGSQVVGVSQTLRHWIERHLCLAGRPLHWALAHILIMYILSCLCISWVLRQNTSLRISEVFHFLLDFCLLSWNYVETESDIRWQLTILPSCEQKAVVVENKSCVQFTYVTVM